MATTLITELSMAGIAALRDRLTEAVRATGVLQEAAQAACSTLYEHLQASAVLIRMYATFRVRELPETYRSFATGVAGAGRADRPLSNDTLVLSLLGSRGAERGWNDPRQSRNHLAIPLLASRYVEGIPMVARLMTDMGVKLGWFDGSDPSLAIRKIGEIAGVFYVDDARTAVDQRGRKIVPAQDFVSAHGVRTVFGLGGSYRSGPFVAAVVFCRERLQRHQVELLMPVVSTFKAATISQVLQRRFFS